MDEKLQILLNQIDYSKDKYSSFDGAVLEVIKGNKEKDNYVFYINLKNPLTPEEYNEFITKLPLAFPKIKNVSSNLTVSNINQDDVKSYYYYFLESYIEENPLLEMFKENQITIVDHEIKIEVGNLAEKMKLSSITSRLLEDLDLAGFKNFKTVIYESEE